MKRMSQIVNKLINESLDEKAEELTRKIKERAETNEDLGVDELNFEDEFEIDLPKGKRIMKYQGVRKPKINANDEMGIYTFKDDKGEVPMSINRLNKNVKKYMKENDMEEGNAFTGALSKAKKMGKDSFTVDGKKYDVKENELDEILHGKQTKLDKNKNGKIDSEDFKMLKKGKKNEMGEGKENLEKNLRKYIKRDHEGPIKENKKSIQIEYNVKFGDDDITLNEDELIDMIEELVIEEKGKSKGLVQYDKVHKKDGEENKKAMNDVAKKMSQYAKDMDSKFVENPDYFPKTSGEIKKMDKKAYIPSEAVDEYVDAFAYPGQTNIVFDEIKPDDEMIKKYIKGDKTTGNSSEYANAVKTGVGDKFYKNYEDNLYGAEQLEASYKRQNQPVDIAGENKSKGNLKSIKGSKSKSQKIFDKLGESEEIENKTMVNEEMEKMKMLIGYNEKTQ
jgi:hypothetical protein